jgi:putative hydrolase of the HAD superfamily
LRAVLFDLGGTLIKTAPIPEIFHRILAVHGVKVKVQPNQQDLEEIMAQTGLDDYRLPFEKFWRIYNAKALRRMGLKGNLDKLADAVSDEWWDHADLKLHADVRDTLKALRKKNLKIGLVTNGFRKDLEEILSRTGLAGQFDVTVGIDDVGKPKPEKEIFLYALKRLGVSASQALFVGDHPQADYEGAKAVGMKPLLVDRDNTACGPFEKIAALTEVLKYI